MTTHEHAQTDPGPDPLPKLKTISREAPWEWMAAGWSDLLKTSRVSLFYGFCFAAISAVITLSLLALDLTALVMALAAGFVLMGPILAVGLYETSRRLQAGEPITLKEVFLVKTRAPAQLFFLGMILMIVFLIWIRIATLLFALFYGLDSFPPLSTFVSQLLFTVHGLTFLTIGSIIGGFLALIVFAISAVSVPLLMVRNIDAVTAVLLSIDAVKKNFFPMVLWAWIIALTTGFGLMTLYVGLIVTFPLIGHATWHGFQALVDLDA